MPLSPRAAQTPSLTSRHWLPGFQIAFQIVHHQMLVQAQGARQHVLHAGLFPDVIAGSGIPVFLRASGTGPAIADVGQGESPAPQHQGGEGGEQRLAAAVGL